MALLPMHYKAAILMKIISQHTWAAWSSKGHKISEQGAISEEPSEFFKKACPKSH